MNMRSTLVHFAAAERIKSASRKGLEKVAEKEKNAVYEMEGSF